MYANYYILNRRGRHSFSLRLEVLLQIDFISIEKDLVM
jgi:hypothetical protein